MRALTAVALATAFIGIGEGTTSVPSETRTLNKIMCDIPGYGQHRGVDPGVIADGIEYLNGLSGDATLGHQEGGGWCFRYSCSWDSGIYGCNNNQFDVKVPWSTLADYAHKIKDNCTWTVEDGQHHWVTVEGQAFDSDGWNVIVGLKDGEKC
ncbi:hypothetical protein VP1G_08957 [Cytospora mali]|uniref:Uncharacterized protein n=1 Tax=Cytospora mali TaxID=578113 RepID=A0A194VD14_CYTMA|nr:hypothetical protein VP1G_08957 [Valsa mali var. pyri (nom. inval.)]